MAQEPRVVSGWQIAFSNLKIRPRTAVIATTTAWQHASGLNPIISALSSGWLGSLRSRRSGQSILHLRHPHHTAPEQALQPVGFNDGKSAGFSGPLPIFDVTAGSCGCAPDCMQNTICNTPNGGRRIAREFNVLSRVVFCMQKTFDSTHFGG